MHTFIHPSIHTYAYAYIHTYIHTWQQNPDSKVSILKDAIDYIRRLQEEVAQVLVYKGELERFNHELLVCALMYVRGCMCSCIHVHVADILVYKEELESDLTTSLSSKHVIMVKVCLDGQNMR